MVHINYTGYFVNHNLQISSQKHKPPPRLTFTLPKSFVLSLITCYNLLTTQQIFDSRGVLDIQYCSLYFNIYPYPKLLLPVCTVHYNRAPVISVTPHVWNQISLVVQNMFISAHEIERTLVFKQGSTPQIPTTTSLYETTTPRYEECSRLFSGTPPRSQPPHCFTPLTIVKINHFSGTFLSLLHIFARQ
jgi:hypothetical protein